MNINQAVTSIPAFFKFTQLEFPGERSPRRMAYLLSAASSRISGQITSPLAALFLEMAGACRIPLPDTHHSLHIQ